MEVADPDPKPKVVLGKRKWVEEASGSGYIPAKQNTPQPSRATKPFLISQATFDIVSNQPRPNILELSFKSEF